MSLQETAKPSPFITGTSLQFAWDSTSLGWLKTCPRLYYYHMIEGWGLSEDNIHLRFGIEFHQALNDYEVHRLKQLGHRDAVEATTLDLLKRIHDWDPKPRPGKKSEEVKTKFALLRTVVWYLEKHKDDPAKTHMLKDDTLATELSFKFTLDWGPSDAQPYMLCGHLDRVVDFAGDLFVMDRKTTTTTPGSYYFDKFQPDNQMSLYSFAGQIVMNSPIKGVIIDSAQILADASHFVRGFTYRTPEQIEEWLRDLEWWLNMAEAFAEANYWPQNDTSCDKFGGCRFRGVCSKSPHVRQKFLESDFKRTEKWNPLIER